MPNAAYWSDDWLKLEQELCFARAWVFAGAEAELPEPGDMKPMDIGGAPLIILRRLAKTCPTSTPGGMKLSIVRLRTSYLMTLATGDSCISNLKS